MGHNFNYYTILTVYFNVGAATIASAMQKQDVGNLSESSVVHELEQGSVETSAVHEMDVVELDAAADDKSEEIAAAPSEGSFSESGVVHELEQGSVEMDVVELDAAADDKSEEIAAAPLEGSLSESGVVHELEQGSAEMDVVELDAAADDKSEETAAAPSEACMITAPEQMMVVGLMKSMRRNLEVNLNMRKEADDDAMVVDDDDSFLDPDFDIEKALEDLETSEGEATSSEGEVLDAALGRNLKRKQFCGGILNPSLPFNASEIEKRMPPTDRQPLLRSGDFAEESELREQNAGSLAAVQTRKNKSKRLLKSANDTETGSKTDITSMEAGVQLDACPLDQESSDSESVKLIKIDPKKKVADGCKQVYDKCNYCTFCEKRISSKISRHLLTHKGEKEIDDIILLPKRCPERMARLRQLANDGNFKHNASTIAAGSGQVVVGRRSKNARIDPTKFLPCEFCHKFLSKNNLWRHIKTCSARNERIEQKVSGDQADEKQPVRQSAVSRGRWVLNSAVFKSSEKCFGDMLSRMRDDRLKEIVTNDKLIRQYAILRLQSLGNRKVQKHNDVYRVSQSARLLARLVEEARKRHPGLTREDIIHPSNFDLVVEIANAMSINKDQPALNVGRSLGLIVNHVALVKNGVALRSGDQIKGQDALNFRKLHKAEWNYRVNIPAVKCINAEKRSKSSSIPLTEDLQILRQYIISNMKSLMKNFKETASPQSWTRLAKLTMSRLILFNKRRRAEVKDLKVADYLQRPDWHQDASDEMALALSPVDKLLARRYYRECLSL
jgi:hypothetical protein